MNYLFCSGILSMCKRRRIPRKLKDFIQFEGFAGKKIHFYNERSKINAYMLPDNLRRNFIWKVFCSFCLST